MGIHISQIRNKHSFLKLSLIPITKQISLQFVKYSSSNPKLLFILVCADDVLVSYLSLDLLHFCLCVVRIWVCFCLLFIYFNMHDLLVFLSILFCSHPPCTFFPFTNFVLPWAFCRQMSYTHGTECFAFQKKERKETPHCFVLAYHLNRFTEKDKAVHLEGYNAISLWHLF